MKNKMIAKMLPKFVLSFHSILVMFGATAVAQAQPLVGTQDGNILTQNQASQATINALVDSIKANANGPLTQANIAAAISEALASTPGVSLATVAGALNSLNLTSNVLVAATEAVSSSMSAPQENIVGALITNVFMNKGREAADNFATSLRDTFGSDVVDQALAQGPTASFQNASQLAQIQPAAGDDVYTG